MGGEERGWEESAVEADKSQTNRKNYRRQTWEIGSLRKGHWRHKCKIRAPDGSRNHSGYKM